MRFPVRPARSSGNLVIGAAVVALTGGGLAAATHPAVAAATFAAVAGTVTCATTGTTACESYTNTSSGIGIYGTSKNGTAVRAASTSNYGLKSTSASADAIYGQVTSSSATASAGVYGTSPSGYGVYGQSTDDNGIGVYGLSNSYIGVLAGTKSGTGTGVYAASVSGSGVAAYTSKGNALYADGINSGTGVYATSGTGIGVDSQTAGGVAFNGRNANGNGADIEGTYIGIIGRAPASGGYPLVLTDPNGNDLFQVDGGGNVRYSGSIQPYVRTKGGATITAFTPEISSPTMEDTGTATLARGTASVRLDPAFAATIDTATPYRVFITPNGDTHGVYVATKTMQGFVVRENQGGRSTASFDYRIVAAALGQSNKRMTAVEPSATIARVAPLHLTPKPREAYVRAMPVVK